MPKNAIGKILSLRVPWCLSDFRQAPLDLQWSQSSRILMSYQVEWNLGLIFAIVVFG